MEGKHAAQEHGSRPFRGKVALIVVVVLVLLSLLSRCGKNKEAESVPDASVSVEDLVAQCQASTDKSFPERNKVVYNAETKQLAISVWIDDLEVAAASAMADTTGTREAWETMKTELVSACSAWQAKFDQAGFSDVTVTMFMLNPSNLDNALLAASGGEIIYDVVEEYLSR